MPVILGKSTTLKSTVTSLFLRKCITSIFLSDFRMRFATAEWEKERAGWRSVVQLNVVRSIITILRVIEAEINGDVPFDSEDEVASSSEMDEAEATKFTDRHQLLIIRLAPLNGVEAELKRRLGAGTEPVPPAASPMSATPFEEPDLDRNTRRKPEFSVRSWKEVLHAADGLADAPSQSLESVTSTIADCKDDMKALWEDKAVRNALKRRRLQLGDSAGLYVQRFPFTPFRCLLIYLFSAF
jgi:guanine nucleotide-binding protein alpha-1 subunit